jgi:hypothetical protein
MVAFWEGEKPGGRGTALKLVMVFDPLMSLIVLTIELCSVRQLYSTAHRLPYAIRSPGRVDNTLLRQHDR